MNKIWYGACSLGLILSLILTGFSVVDALFGIINEKPPREFVDKNKDPQYYINRYYNEIEYRYWFDRNYPNHTIEAVGYFENKPHKNSIKNEIIPEA